MRVLACGGRDYFDRQVIYTTLTKLHRENQVMVLVHGGASGADTLASEWAATMGVPAEAYVADWKKYGRAAGVLRNTDMLMNGKPDLVVAFPGGRGTADMVSQAKKAGVPVSEIKGDKQNG